MKEKNRKEKRKKRLCCYFDLYPSTCLTWGGPTRSIKTAVNIAIRVTEVPPPHHEKVTAHGERQKSDKR